MKDYNIYVYDNRYEIFNSTYKKVATLYDGILLDFLISSLINSETSYRIHFGEHTFKD